jgi:hypothetical protein
MWSYYAQPGALLGESPKKEWLCQGKGGRETDRREGRSMPLRVGQVRTSDGARFPLVITGPVEPA